LADAVETDRALGFEIDTASRQPQGEMELAAGNHGEAVRLLRQSCQDLERLGDRSYWATDAALLADALERAGEVAEAERVATEAQAASARDDLVNFVLTDVVLARIHLRRDEIATAEQFARRAAEVAQDTDFAVMKGETLVALAQVLHAAGNEPDARDAIAEAIGHYERKGDLVGTRRARALAADLGLLVTTA
jgi:tetratricopeptide (TPR) repeat protein